MNKTNIFFITLSLVMFSTLSQAANPVTQLKDLGMDGEARLYDVMCANGKGTTIFQPVGPALADEVEPLPEDAEIIELDDDSGIDFKAESKPRVCTAIGGGEIDCAVYKDIDTAAEAVCKTLG